MNNTSANNRRIARNTIVLYIRTLLTMAIGLYTSRIVLNVLGVDDYGIYNVVGGMVAMLSIVTASLSSAISRFLTVEMGKSDSQRLNLIFCTSVNIQILMSCVFLVLAEIIGVWFLNGKMNIAADRMVAANWVLQFSILSFIVNLVSVPYNAAIIAHEQMKAFAYISILEAVLKLAIAFCLYLTPIDKLTTYALLMLLVALGIRFIYGHYCSRHFEECHYSLIFDRKLFKSMSNFAGWSFVASSLYVFNTQGVNIISNIFFGVGVNAARGIANQVEDKTKTFVSNFQTAVKPQVMKSYSSGDHDYMISLICKSTKFSYFLMLLFAVPIFFETEEILALWLKNYPGFSPVFVRFTLVIALITILGDMLYTNVLAIGQLKRYVKLESVITCCVFPLSLLLFSNNYPPQTSYVLFALAYFALIFVRLIYLHRLEAFPIIKYVKEVLGVVALTTFISIIPPALCAKYCPGMGFMTQTIICLASVAATVYLVGMTKREKSVMLNKIKSFRLF